MFAIYGKKLSKLLFAMIIINYTVFSELQNYYFFVAIFSWAI